MKYFLSILFFSALITTCYAQQDIGPGLVAPRKYFDGVVSVDLDMAVGPNSTTTFVYGLGARWRTGPNFRLGFSDLSYMGADIASGTRSALTVGPACEYYYPISSSFVFNAHAAVPIQWRFGADAGSKFGIAPYIEPEIAFMAGDEFSIGLNMKVQYVLSDGFLRLTRVVPQNAVIYAVGLSCNFLF